MKGTNDSQEENHIFPNIKERYVSILINYLQSCDLLNDIEIKCEDDLEFHKHFKIDISSIISSSKSTYIKFNCFINTMPWDEDIRDRYDPYRQLGYKELRYFISFPKNSCTIDIKEEDFMKIKQLYKDQEDKKKELDENKALKELEKILKDFQNYFGEK